MWRRTKIRTEYRQTGGEADGENIVVTGTKYLTMSSSNIQAPMSLRVTDWQKNG